MNNFFLYRPGKDAPAQLIAWDKDVTFSRIDMPPSHNMAANVLTAKAWSSPPLRELYLRRLVESAAWDSWLDAEAGRLHGLIREAALEDPVKPVSNIEFEEAVGDVRHYLRARGTIVRRLVAAGQ
jgi:hypothetical protein